VVIIDDIRVRVAHRPMAMRMAVGLGSFPTFMVMIVMGTVGVFVLVGFLRVGVHQHRLVTFRPQRGSQGREPRDKYSLYAAGSLLWVLWGIHNPTGSLALIVSAGLG
jgi:hypothetical protein